jgi:uncharacterized protein YjdB
MKATGFFSDGSQRDLTGQVRWASTDPGTISVNAAGVISCVQTGEVTIIASGGSVRGSTPATCTVLIR